MTDLGKDLATLALSAEGGLGLWLPDYGWPNHGGRPLSFFF